MKVRSKKHPNQALFSSQTHFAASNSLLHNYIITMARTIPWNVAGDRPATPTTPTALPSYSDVVRYGVDAFIDGNESDDSGEGVDEQLEEDITELAVNSAGPSAPVPLPASTPQQPLVCQLQSSFLPTASTY